MTASHVPVVDGDAALPVAFPESHRLRLGGDRRYGYLGGGALGWIAAGTYDAIVTDTRPEMGGLALVRPCD